MSEHAELHHMRNESGQFIESNKPLASITVVSVPPNGYYVLRLGDREIGGESRSALERYARKEGFKVTNA